MACLTLDGRYLLTFLAVGIIPEVLWTIDFFSVIFGHPLIGSTSFMFEYGENPFRFLMNLPHLLLLPCALLILPKMNLKKNAKKQILIWGAIVIAAGYFLSGLNVDINCVHNLCYPKPLDIERVAVSLVCLYIAICALMIEPAIRKLATKVSSKKVLRTAQVLFVIAIIGMVLAFVKYGNMPHYTCQSNKDIQCERFFMDRERNVPYLQFSLKENKADECLISWMIDGEKLTDYPVVAVKSGQNTIYLPNFDSGNRKISSQVICPAR